MLSCSVKLKNNYGKITAEEKILLIILIIVEFSSSNAVKHFFFSCLAVILCVHVSARKCYRKGTKGSALAIATPRFVKYV